MRREAPIKPDIMHLNYIGHLTNTLIMRDLNRGANRRPVFLHTSDLNRGADFSFFLSMDRPKNF